MQRSYSGIERQEKKQEEVVTGRLEWVPSHRTNHPASMSWYRIWSVENSTEENGKIILLSFFRWGKMKMVRRMMSSKCLNTHLFFFFTHTWQKLALAFHIHIQSHCSRQYYYSSCFESQRVFYPLGDISWWIWRTTALHKKVLCF